MKSKKQAKARVTSSSEAPSALATFIRRYEFTIILALCILAGLRIFLFSAAFPPINNIDEQAHYDIVWRYAHGDPPDGMQFYNIAELWQIAKQPDHERLVDPLDFYSYEATWRINLFASPEYLLMLGNMLPEDVPPPGWKNLTPELEQQLDNISASWSRERTNHEATQPPLYYIAAGYWFNLGKALGMGDGALFYWIRFFNIPILMLTVLLAFAYAIRFFPGSTFMRVGTPLMVASIPQDVFYSINNDIPAALLFGAALYGLLDIYLSESRKSYTLYAATGLLAAAAFLTKISSFAILPAVMVVTVLRCIKALRVGSVKQEIPGLAMMLILAAVPVGYWLVKNQIMLGDLTGTAAKIERLGWTHKSFGSIWNHPIFSLEGFSYFWGKLMHTFWRGEFVWHLRDTAQAYDIRYPLSDAVYSGTSFVLLLAGSIAIFLRKETTPAQERIVHIFGAATVWVTILFFIYVSMAFDFGWCFYPSAERPFLSSGRLLLGALIPFALLYLHGMKVILPGKKWEIARVAALAIIVAIMIGTEIPLSLPAFRSQYNWFHML